MRENSNALQDLRQKNSQISAHLKRSFRRPTRCALFFVVGLGWLLFDGCTFAGARPARTSRVEQQCGSRVKLHAASKARLNEMHLDAMKKINKGSKQEGIRQLMEVADEGCLGAMRDLGIMYSQGFHGLQQDIQLGLQWSTRASDGGDASASYNLACTYLAGMNGVTVNKREAAKRFAMAGEGGISAAMTNLATMLIKGDGIPRDMQLGAQWLVRAAEKNGKLEELMKQVEQGNVDPETAQAMEENMARLRQANKENPYDKIDGKVEYWDDLKKEQQEKKQKGFS